MTKALKKAFEAASRLPDREQDELATAIQRLCQDRKSTRLNSSHVRISYAVFCLKKKRPQAEHAIMIANAHRGTPIHMLLTREQDFIGTTYRAMVMARLNAGIDADCSPITIEVRN